MTKDATKKAVQIVAYLSTTVALGWLQFAWFLSGDPDGSHRRLFIVLNCASGLLLVGALATIFLPRESTILVLPGPVLSLALVVYLAIGEFSQTLPMRLLTRALDHDWATYLMPAGVLSVASIAICIANYRPKESSRS